MLSWLEGSVLPNLSVEILDRPFHDGRRFHTERPAFVIFRLNFKSNTLVQENNQRRIRNDTHTQKSITAVREERQILQSDDPPPTSSCVTSNMISFKRVTIKRAGFLFSSMVRYSRSLRNWANRGRAHVSRWGSRSDQNECQWFQCGGYR